MIRDVLRDLRVIPLLGVDLFRDVLGNQHVDQFVTHAGDGLGDVLLTHQIDALVEDDAALVVHDVVELEQVLAEIEVPRLDLLPSVLSMPSMRSEPKMRIRSSCSDRKNLE